MHVQPLVQGLVSSTHFPTSFLLGYFPRGPPKVNARFLTPHFSVFLRSQHQVVLQTPSWALLPLCPASSTVGTVLILMLILAACRASWCPVHLLWHDLSLQGFLLSWPLSWLEAAV